MTRRPLMRVLLGVLMVLGLAGCAGGPGQDADPSVPGPVDIGFCQDMSVHHAQALLMAQQALTLATDPTVRALATQILISQSQERGTMTGWLTLWKAPQLPSGPPMTWMAAHATDLSSRHDMAGMPGTPTEPGNKLMPGMATQAELDQLATARGHDFDTEFLRLMVRHHLGGIAMAQHAQTDASTSEVRALAGSMVIAQTEENGLMTRLIGPP